MADETSKKKNVSKSTGEPGPRTRKRAELSVENVDVPAGGAKAPASEAKTAPRPRSASTRKKPAVPAETVVVTPVPTPDPAPVAVSSASTATVTPTVPVDTGGPVAEAYIEKEIRRARSGLRATALLGLIFVIAVAVSLGYITDGFAASLEPTEAATITQGIVQSHIDDYLPDLKRQIKEQVPLLIGKVPDYAKEQLPKYRAVLEDRLAKAIQEYANQTAPQLDGDLQKFLTNNKESVRQLMLNGQDPQATATLGTNMKQMFIDYLNQTQLGGETLQSKIDSGLSELTSVDARVARLAANKGLTENEKRARRAIAILLRSVDENPDLQQAASLVQSIDTTPMNGTLQFKSPDEAVFQAPGKPPMVFVRKKEAPPVVPPLKSSTPPPTRPRKANAIGAVGA